MASNLTADDVAAFTGRPDTDPHLEEVIGPAYDVLDRYYVLTDVDQGIVDLAHLHMCRWVLQARQGDVVDAGALGVTYLPRYVPAVEKLLRRKGGFA